MKADSGSLWGFAGGIWHGWWLAVSGGFLWETGAKGLLCKKHAGRRIVVIGADEVGLGMGLATHYPLVALPSAKRAAEFFGGEEGLAEL